MNNENKVYDASELAWAAYFDLVSGETLGQLPKSENENLESDFMTSSQIKFFSERWPEIIGQYTDPDTDVSLTVFRNGNDVAIAIRGTAPFDTDFGDLWADIQLGTGFIPSQYQALKEIYAGLLAENIIRGTDNVTLTGHSLGGFLAQLLAVDYAGDFVATYTYNAPGIGGMALDLFGIPDQIGAPNIINVRGDGFSLVATVGTSLGSVQEIQIENSLLSPADHSIVKLTDSLAVYNVLAKLDPSLTVNQYNDIFNSSKISEDYALEGMVNHLYQLLGEDVSLVKDSRTSLYQALDDLQSNATFQALADADVRVQTQASGQAARSDFGAFISLVQFSPLLVSTPNAQAEAALTLVHNELAAIWQQDNSLPNAERSYTDQYLHDRALMLNAYMDAAHNGRIRPATVNGGEMAIGQFAADGYVYATDLTKNISVKSHEFLPSDQTLGLHFGSDAAESFQGGAGVDRIYAGSGNDTLQGNNGNDYLEGGAGADTYIWNNGDGSDTIIETADGSTNALLINGVNLASLTLIKIDGEDSWLVENNASGIYAIGRNNAGDVFISVHGQAGVVLTIKNHQDGDFGLNLNANYDSLEDSIRQTPITDAQGYLVVGDGVFGENDPHLWAKYSQRGDLYNNRDMLFDAQQYFANEDYYPLTSGSRGYLRNYAFEGGKGNDILEGSDWRAVQAAALATGNPILSTQLWERHNGTNDYYGDMINGMEGDDIIYGDKQGQEGDSDELVGGHGSDILFGGGGRDVLYGYQIYNLGGGQKTIADQENQGDSDYLDGGDGDDFLYAGSYSDILLGGEGNDHAFGGAGQDIILGGNGDDVLFGDSSYHRFDSSFYGNFITPDYVNSYYNVDFLLLDRFDPIVDFNDFISGGDGNDSIIGEIGSDMLFGGSGDDRIQGDRTNYYLYMMNPDSTEYYNPLPYLYNGQIYHGDDYIDGGDGHDTIDGNGGDDFILGGRGNDIIRGDDDMLEGQFHGDDIIYGEDGDDHIEGNGGHDFIDGGNGDDVIVGDWMNSHKIIMEGSKDFIIPLAPEFHGDDELHGGAGNDLIYGNGGNDLIYGGEGDDRLYGDDYDLDSKYHGNDTIFGGIGNDRIYGNGGNDLLYGDEGDDQLVGGEGNDILYGGEGNDLLWGDEGDDVLHGGAGNDQLSGGMGTDWLYGGAGNDVYVYAAGDGITYIEDESGLDSLVLQGISSQSISLGLGSLLIRTGQAGDEIHILGFDGADLSSISIEYFYFSDGAFTGQQLVQQYGFQLDSFDAQGRVWGTSFHDRILLNQQATYANGGGGDDSYVVSRNSLSHVRIQDESGSNTLELEGFADRSEVQFSLEQNDLLLSFTNEDGEQASVLIQRNEGGRFAVDTLTLANEALNVSDIAAQLANAQNIAPVLLDDYAQLLAPTGSVQGNVLANDHDDNGDALSVINSGTQVGQFGRLELSTNGAYSYHANEALLATLAAGESVTDVFSYQASDGLHSGNAQLAIGLVGVNDAPVVNRGMDKQSGTAGEAFSFVVANDAFLDVDNGDRLALSAGLSNGAMLPNWLSFDAASQTFRSLAQAEAGEYDIQVTATDLAGANISTTFTLTIHPAVVPEGVNLKGSIFNDTLVGTDYDDVLDGGLGADTMKGGKGNDTYFVNYNGLLWGLLPGDRVVELADEGYDTVKSSVSYTLPDNVEALQLLDDLLAITATGNNLDNHVQGNRYANTLYGLAGDDVLVGGKGNDKLHGGTGNDTYVFARGDGNDTIYNDETSYDAVDILQFADVNYESLWLTRKGSDLLVDVLGGGGQVKVTNWYGDSRAQMDYIQAANGTLEASSVDQLVAAMATFKMPKGSGMEIPQDVQQQLEPVLTASWG